MKETELKIAAKFGGKEPTVFWMEAKDGWVIGLEPASPADHWLILDKARGGPRIFKRLNAALNVCHKLGLTCRVEPKP